MKKKSNEIVASCCKVKFVLLLFLTLTVVDGHWVCDLADVACNDATVAMMCNTQNMNRWAKPSSAEVVSTKGKMPCAMRCAQQGCLCAVYDEEQGRCISAFADQPLPSSTAGLTRVLGPNLALEKPVNASNHFKQLSYEHRNYYAVDGNVTPDYKFYCNAHTSSQPWFVVDLEESRVIKTMRFLSRQDGYLSDRFFQIAVLVGDTLASNGDFSSYQLVTVVPDPHPALGYWYFLDTKLQRPFRYVALQRWATTGLNYLEIAELEVYA